MRLRGKRERTDSAMTAEPKKRVARGSSNTYGRSLVTKAGTVALAFCVISGPLALLGSCSPRQTVVQAAPTTSVNESPQQQAAGSYALGFVVSWLSATRERPGDLAAYIDVRSIESALTDEPWVYRDPAVGSVRETDTTGISAVIVSATVKATEYDKDGNAVDVWHRRYFQVPVSITGEDMRILALPAPVAGPLQGAEVQTRYSDNLSESTAAGSSVREFLAAYLTGSGDITRFVSPSALITAIEPALFEQISAIEMRADRAEPQTPGDGANLHLLVHVTAVNGESRALTSTYALSLTARAGRWEVAAIEPAPLVVQTDRDLNSPTPTNTSTPTGTDDQ